MPETVAAKWNRVWRLAAMAVAVLFALGAGAMRANSSEPAAQTVTINLLDDPLAKFSKLMPVVGHPRCTNCHGGTNPFSGLNHPDPIDKDVAASLRDKFGDMDFMNVKEANDVCQQCHDDGEEAKQWVLAHKFTSFVGQTPRQICAIWKSTPLPFGQPAAQADSAQNLLNHLNGDPLIKLAFKGNKGVEGRKQDKPPKDFDEFFALAKDWLKNGDDIPCAGWEGTITQTETVDLTTNYSAFQVAQVGLEDHTTEVQQATRTTTITINGGVSLRIAVQGSHRIDHTLVMRQGAQSCTTTDKRTRTFGTTQGEIVADAKMAEVTLSPGGAYTIRIEGPEEQTRGVEVSSMTTCVIGTVGDPATTSNFNQSPWVIEIKGVRPIQTDQNVLTGTKQETVMNQEDAWLTKEGGGMVFPFQARDNNDVQPVPVKVVTTWNLRRRDN